MLQFGFEQRSNDFSNSWVGELVKRFGWFAKSREINDSSAKTDVPCVVALVTDWNDVAKSSHQQLSWILSFLP